MNYRHLGRTGIRVSELSLGSWVTFKNQVDVDAAVQIMAAAYDAGVNFFDNAEAYAGGQSEVVMGAALKKLGWRRGSYLITTKLYWGLYEGVNEKNTLNRKRLIEGLTVRSNVSNLITWMWSIATVPTRPHQSKRRSGRFTI